MKKILVATDGSKCSQEAVRVAKDLAECTGALVKIINVVPEQSTPKFDSVSSGTQAKEIMDHFKRQKEHSELLSNKILDEALKEFEGFLGEVTAEKITGEPAMEIIKEAEEGNYDLIVMGCRAHGFFERMIGSTTNKVLNYTDKKVLTV